MKKIYLTLLSCFIAIVTMAQTPGFSYQAVILNPNTQILPGNNVEQGLLSESNIMLRFTIENDGGAEYQETHTTKTDAYGMVSLMVGQGMATIGNFTEVAWVGSEKYLKVEIDFTASGASYESLDRQALTYIPQPVSNETMAILDQINADVSSNNDAIQNEVTRATIAEQANTDALDAEIVRATAAEGVNATAIADETTRATTAEGVNATAIADENTRATASEGVNATAIADENTRATAAEGVNATAVSNETTRATNAEQANADAILVEETRATNSEQANANAISVEETRATNSEQANADAILVEETRATNSEQANADAISAEATRATNAEQANADAISVEATRATNAEQANADAISAEETRATEAEGVNADAITAEAVIARAAELANAAAILSHNINDLDMSNTNEIQTLEVSGDTIYLSSDNTETFVVIPGLNLVSSLIIEGCTDPTSCNYDMSANTDNGSCTYAPSNADCSGNCLNGYTLINGECVETLMGCTNITAWNYDSLANTDDGSCGAVINIGDTYQGGIVFYVASEPTDLNGDGILDFGLLAGPVDIGHTVWGVEDEYGNLIGDFGCPTTYSGATGSNIGTGAQNTNLITNACSRTNNAAGLCADYSNEGYTDWFLPSKDEMVLMYDNIGESNVLGLGNIGGFEDWNARYISSTELNCCQFWKIYSQNSGNPNYVTTTQTYFADKDGNYGYRTRPVRAF